MIHQIKDLMPYLFTLNITITKIMSAANPRITAWLSCTPASDIILHNYFGGLILRLIANKNFT